MKKVIALALALVATSVLAKPILWFHFDEEAPGTLAPRLGTVVNAANPGTLDGTIRGLNWNSTTMTDNRRITYTNAIDTATPWYDPVSGTRGDTISAFVGISGPVAGTGASALVTVPDSEALHLDKFTAEFFFRKDPDGIFASQVLPVQLYNSAGNTFAWQVRFDKDCSSMTLTVTSDSNETTGRVFSVPQNFSNGWHHVALVYTGSALKLYYDYQIIGTRNCTVAYAENAEDAILAIGNSSRSTWGRYHGFIDEFRISDEVLAPDQFLRPLPLLCDKDTLVYVSGKQADVINFSGYGTANNLNEVCNGITAVQAQSVSGKLPESVDASPSDSVRADLFATNIVADAASLFFETNAAAANPGRTARIAIADVVGEQHTLLTNDELTVEFFMKASPQAEDKSKDTKYLIGCHTRFGGQYLSIRENKTYNDKFVINLRSDQPDASQASFISPTTARDGNWHHVAIVQDRPQKEVYFYVDYRLEKVYDDFLIDTLVNTNSYFKDFNFCAAYNAAQPTNFRGWMDEIRITRRALKPSEFLTTREVPTLPKVAGKQVLFYAPFDENLRAYPFTNEMVGVADDATKVSLDPNNRPLEWIAARSAMGLATNNAAALVANGGRITYDDTTTIAGMKSMTIEFYARAPQASNWTPFVRYEDEKVCHFQVCKSASGQLAVMVVTDKMNGTGQYVIFDTTKLKRSFWHHYAVTIEKKTVEGETVTEVRAWADHVELEVTSGGRDTRTYPGELPHTGSGDKLFIGRAMTWASLTGAIDEVRITEGVLDVKDFLDLCPRLGGVFIAR